MKKEKIQRKNWRFVRVLEKRAKEEEARAKAEQSAKRKAAIRRAIELTEQRDAARFDALEGSPPEWMPKADIPKWREARRFMLDKFPKDQVQAWIKGAPGPQIPDDDFGEVAQSLQILRAVAYLTIAKQRSKGGRNSAERSRTDNAKRIQAIHDKATELLKKRPKHEISGVLAREFQRSRASILTVLKTHQSGQWSRGAREKKK